MVDYNKSVGTAGTMIIRDNGSTVSFIIACSDSGTFIGSYVWSGVVNGSAVGGTVTLSSGFGSKVLGTWTVSSSQTVTFHQNATGTMGLGGAADHSAFINRATVPAKPAKPTSSAVGAGGMTLHWAIPSNGGAAIDAMLLRRNSVTPVSNGGYVDYSNGGAVTSRVVTGLAAGELYYWGVYAHNAVGYSTKSDDLYSPTLPAAPTTPTTSGVGATGMTVTWTKGANGSAISGYDLVVATNPSFTGAATYSQSGTSKTLTGLNPGDIYYLRVRAKTASGAGAYSATKTQATVLGTPISLAFSAVTPTTLTLAWGAVSGATGYDIQYATNPSFTGAVTVTSATASKAVTGITAGQTYYFRVRAKTADVTGAWSATASTNTPPTSSPGIAVAPSAPGTSATVTLSPPSGAAGVTKYTIERRLGATTTSRDVTTTSYSWTGLTPGVTYEWRAFAWFDTYKSPASGWISVEQPNPSTNPGDYFDGSTAAREDNSFRWTGTANSSTSEAVGLHPTGWMTFAQGAAGLASVSGAVYRGTGGLGPLGGAHSVRVVFFTDTPSWGFRAGTAEAAPGLAAAIPETTYAAAIALVSPRAKRLAAVLRFFDSGGTLLEQIIGPETWVPASAAVQRLTVVGESPLGTAGLAVQMIDVEDGWVPWQGGDVVSLDTAFAIRGGYPIPYFDGATPDGDGYAFFWSGTANASTSYREGVTTDSAVVDPNCPPFPSPPRAPIIESDCIEDVLEWSRSWALLPASAAPTWLDAVPITKLRTGASAERQVRIRFYANPFNRSIERIDVNSYCAEQILTYIPPNTTVTLDGITSNVLAQPRGSAPSNINHLLYGTNGEPALWPVLSCGSPYYITVDVPTDSVPGNLAFDLQMVVQH